MNRAPTSAFASGAITVTLPGASVTTLVASLRSVSRWIVPCSVCPTEIVVSSTPDCVTAWPTIVTSPSVAVTMPPFAAVPPVPTAASVPNTVEVALPVVLNPARRNSVPPAARIVWPDGVAIEPSLVTAPPCSSTRPPPTVGVGAAGVWIRAPASTVTAAVAPTNVGSRVPTWFADAPTMVPYRPNAPPPDPVRNCAAEPKLAFSDPELATSPPTFTCDPAPNRMPFGFRM